MLGALAIGTAVAAEREHASTRESLLRECTRYKDRSLTDTLNSPQGLMGWAL